MTRSPAPESPGELPRALATESSSSKKRMQGAAARACEIRKVHGIEYAVKSGLSCLISTCRTLSNSSRTFASDSPNHIVRSSGPLMDTKLAWGGGGVKRRKFR